jgi:deazaflavin-dependent oxidoreductase (nitroreductase family)
VILGPALAQHPICHLETIGRLSGLPRVIEIWFAVDPDRPRIYLLAGGRDRANWVRNIRHDPRVHLQIDGQRFAGIASDIEGGPDDGLARRLLLEKYEGQDEPGSLGPWARSALPIAIDLEATADGQAVVSARDPDRPGR